MIALLLLSLAASPWTGLWRIQPLPQTDHAPHVYIHEDGTVEMFDTDWSPFDVHESKLGEDELFLRFTLEAHTKMRRLTLSLKGDRLEGSMEILAGGGQFPIEQPISAIKVAATMPPTPQKWIKDIRQEDHINVLAALEMAPRESFDDFLKFWDEEIEPVYYPVLAAALYGQENSLDLRRERLRKLFGRLSEYGDELKAWPQRADQALQEAAQGHRGLQAQMRQGICKVLLPVFSDPEVDMYPVATVRLERKPGQKICCGSRGYTIENFAFIQLAPPPSEAQAEAKDSPQGR